MHQNTERLRATHVGSLIRPPQLVEFLRRREAGQRVDEAAFAICLERSVREVVEQQTAAGLDIINDGEFGKTISWSRYILERLSGVVQEQRRPDDASMPAATVGKDRRDFAQFYAAYDRSQGFSSMVGWVVTGAIRYTGHADLKRDIDDLARALGSRGTRDAFITAVAPASVLPGREDRFYANDEQFLFAIADALHEEYRAIVDAGFMLQVDDAYLATYFDVIVPPGTQADYRKWAELRVAALNRALRGIPEERVRYHVCWGSWNGPHVSDVPLRQIIDLIVSVNAGSYALEMANPRHEHEWRLFEQVRLPPNKVLLPGVISHSTNVVEHPELVAERLVRLARLVGRERVIASTDCGFAQGPFVQRVHPSIMWAKLQSLVEGTRIASRELWGSRASAA